MSPIKYGSITQEEGSSLTSHLDASKGKYPQFQQLMSDILGGVICFFLSSVIIISYSSILFPGEANFQLFNAATYLASLGCCIVGLYIAFASKLPYAIACIDLFTYCQ
jgi:xanthine/uracil/vitamin C permease (AzgA family)